MYFSYFFRKNKLKIFDELKYEISDFWEELPIEMI